MGRFYAYTLELGKEAILDKCVWYDILTASSFSHNIGFLHHQLINETDDAVPLCLRCYMDRHIWGENSILSPQVGAQKIPVFRHCFIVKMPESEVWIHTKNLRTISLPYAFCVRCLIACENFEGMIKEWNLGIYI